MCIAVNFYVKSWGHQDTLIGPNRGILFCISGTNVSWNKCNWTVSNFWSNRSIFEYWRFVQYVAVLDENRWLKRVLAWHAGGGRLGRSFDLWDAPGRNFAGGRALASGRLQPRTKFFGCSTCRMLLPLCICIYLLGLTPVPKWAAHHGIQEQNQKSLDRRQELIEIRAWNEVLHVWNERVRNFIANAHANTWSSINCKISGIWHSMLLLCVQFGGFQRLLSWHAFGTRRVPSTIYVGIKTPFVMQVHKS